ncbi:twin-arginine translocase TatA/TatE family subunit [Flavobacterium chuncheonense]|uniref:Sec-independent protein translocase protein TatA n=1 Tax=Flavobacterium chuncheonense TaxID=2026653 RepID=A0ABW5YMD8_9FLAO
MNALAIFLGAIGPGSWVIIGLAVLLLFGGKKIPELMKGLGGGVKEFKNAMKDEEENKNSKKENNETKE